MAAYDSTVRNLLTKVQASRTWIGLSTKMRSDWYANIENPIDRASALSHATLFDGTFDLVYEIPQDLAKVTAAQVGIAGKYLVATNRTLINRVPAPKEKDTDTAKQPGAAQ